MASHNQSRSAGGAVQRLFGSAVQALGALYILGLLGISAQQALFPQRNGPLALAQVFAPYLFIPLLLALPSALRRRSRSLLAAIVVCGVIAAVRFVPTWISLPPLETPDALRLSAATWNMYVSNHDLDELPGIVAAAEADILAVQELTPPHQSALLNDPEIARRYPWHYLEPGHSDGMGILSRFPIVEQGILRNLDRPEAFPIMWARVELGDGKTLIVVTAHPRAPHTPFRRPMPFPRTFDATGRAADIAFLRAFIDPLLHDNERLLLLGDFNLTEREPDYRDASAGLIDAHLAAGIGSGNTWILSPLRRIDAGLLRIDYLFSSPRVTPLRTSVNCATVGSDHCLVRGVFETH
ncbi:MAG TPA: endonuclease/exonuclease/phosphatase family protein [Herpetosiphonaceae bacterium]